MRTNNDILVIYVSIYIVLWLSLARNFDIPGYTGVHEKLVIVISYVW